MQKLRTALGLLGGILMIGAGFMHSLMGWPEMLKTFAKTNAPADVVQGLAIPWHFTGVSMITFGAIIAALFLARLRGRPAASGAALALACVYLAFGIWVMAFIDANAFFFVIFILPPLLVFAGLPRASA
ncbi:MAG TPA: hypothetical protein VKB93_24225 [Thermoanaerobaculia bacterium]|nr:hypothetical protein [Thermoanaerobaculia bacterium]